MMNKRITNEIRKIHKPNINIKFCLGTLTIVAICIMLLIIATFSQIKIDIPANNMESYLKFEYIPQIPVVLFIAGLLGEFWGLVTILLYIILGLTPYFSFFALGGGLSYIFKYNFGYIFAYIFAVLISAKFMKNNNSILKIILAVLYGVLLIHLIGIIYMVIIAILQHDSAEFILNWIYYQSITKILYDIVFGLIAVLLSKVCRKLLWILID